MIDRRSSTDRPDLSGTDYVLEGVSVRDRFLTAFVLQHNGSLLQGTWPRAASLPDPHPFNMNAAFPGAEEESFRDQVEDAREPLTVRVIDEWIAADDDDM
jgi:hypothetical protein